MGTEDSISNGGYESDDLIAFFGEHDVGRVLKKLEVGFWGGGRGPAFKKAL